MAVYYGNCSHCQQIGHRRFEIHVWLTTEMISCEQTRDCNPGIPNPDCFHQSQIPGLASPNPGISGLQKLVKIIIFRMLNDKKKNFSLVMNKIFYMR